MLGVAVAALAFGVIGTWSLSTGERPKQAASTASTTQPAVAAPTPSLAVIAVPEKPKPAPGSPTAAKAAPLHASRARQHAPPAPAALDPNDGDASPEKIAALGALDGCIAGDGNGCAGVGRWYEVTKHDPVAARRWFTKCCELSSFDACDGVERVKNAGPRRERNADDPLGTSSKAKAGSVEHPAMKL